VVFRAIADPIRREILCRLRRDRRRAGEIAREFSHQPPAEAYWGQMLRDLKNYVEDKA
jgi:DNA-binding transcriptional ArsR family regulator